MNKPETKKKESLLIIHASNPMVINGMMRFFEKDFIRLFARTRWFEYVVSLGYEPVISGLKEDNFNKKEGIEHHIYMDTNPKE